MSRKTKKLSEQGISLEEKIRWKFKDLQEEFQAAGYELVIRRPVSKDLVMFDYGLLFTAGTDDITVYVDDELRAVIKHLLETNYQVVIKSNWMSPDTVALTVPTLPLDALRDVLSDDSKEVVSE